MVKIWSIFVALLENMNFMSENQFRLKVKFKSKVLRLGLQHVQCTLDSMTLWVFKQISLNVITPARSLSRSGLKS